MMPPRCLHLRASRRRTRVPLPQPPLRMSSRTVDVDVIDVIDVTEEEARRQEEQEKLKGVIGNRFKQRPAAEVAKDVRQLLEEAIKMARDAGPQVVGARGFGASRSDAAGVGVEEEGGGGGAKTAGRAGVGGVGAVRSRAGPAQELDPAGAARALRLLFERGGMEGGRDMGEGGREGGRDEVKGEKGYVLEFQKCLDSTEPVPYSKILAVIKEELGGGARVSEEFRYIDPKPLASASVAQVHRAKLRTGEEVVLKVRKPGVEGTLQADLGFLYVASRLLEILQPELGRTSFAAIVSDIRTAMLDELDFRKEAKNIENFTTFLGQADITDAVAPKVYESLSSERLLVMERFKGVPLTDLEGIRSCTDNPEATLITALNTWSMSVMMAESFHADGRVGFIDFGIVGRISQTVWSSVRDLSDGFVSNDYRLIAESLVKMGAADGEVNVDTFAFDIEKVMDKLGSMEAQVDTSAVIDEATGQVTYGAAVNFDQEAITRLLLDIVGVAENNGLKLPREFGMLIKQALYFDRYTRLLAPDLDPLRDDRVTLPNGDGRADAAIR
eukprot:jgi/Undpi1/6413/HiC_scaffold_20.g08894.m1